MAKVTMLAVDRLPLGVFSNVLKCQEVGTDKEVAIKLLRNNEHMKRTGKKEVRILRQLRDSDPEGKSNNVRLLNDFEVRFKVNN